MKKIAIIGTGIMGSGIASNFLKKGYEVYVWNRNKEKLSAFQSLGAIILNTPKQGAEIADIVIEVTANDESSRSVWGGNEGILSGAKSDSILITCATLSINWIEELIELCKNENYIFFDMPMTGGRIGAESGNLTLLVGGDEKRLEEIKPILGAIANKIIYFGDTGSGAKYKLLLNMLQAIHIAGFGEAIKIAKKHGMNLKAVGDALAERPGGTTTIFTWRDYQTPPNPINFSIKWLAKDLNYAKKFADSEQFPLLEDVFKQYQSAVEKGLGDEDCTAINI